MPPFKCVATTLGLLSALGGCALPAAGPTVAQIEAPSERGLDLFVVKVDPAVAETLSVRRQEGFPNSLRLVKYSPRGELRPGDVVGVSIYETGGSLLFGSSQSSGTSPSTSPGQPAPPQPVSSQSTSLPGQIVEADGQIMIPFVGRVPVAGRTPSQAADEIAQRLSVQTVKPQVIVSLMSNTANSAAVGGEVNKAGLVQLSLRGDRLLDVIAQAGGPKYPAIQTDVRVIRERPLPLFLCNRYWWIPPTISW